tara:strand:+ start:806 stop:1012 length:207 start_codon:yes stop_codon:yes gene_type:complete
MLNIIVIVATAMGIVAFGGLAFSYIKFMAYDYALLNLYIVFASGVGLGVCTIGLWDSLLVEWFNRGEA